MKYLLDSLNEKIYEFAQKCVEKENVGFVQLYQIKHNLHKVDDKKAIDFIEGQKKLGYSEDDLEIIVSLSTRNAWYSYINFNIHNKINDTQSGYGSAVSFLTRAQMTKEQLQEALIPEIALIESNRKRILNNPDEARKVHFLQNNLSAMMVDQETHDYILSVINDDKQAVIAAKEAKKQSLKDWALINGSELLKARIEEEMNWLELADEEYNRSRMPEGFDYQNENDFDTCWEYKNPTLEHIELLREARKNEEFTKVELRKCRKTYENNDKEFHYFVIGTMKTYIGTEFNVSKEIDKEYIYNEE